MKRLVGALRVLWVAARNFHNDGAFDMAATVAFYALLAIAPFLYLVSAIARLFVDTDAVIQSAAARLSTFAPPELSASIASVANGISAEPSLAAVAVPGLIWVASSALRALEHALNVTMGTADGRVFWHSRVKALATLIAGGLLLGLSIVGSAVLPELERLREAARAFPLPITESRILVTAAVLGVFATFYKTLPRVEVSWRAALTGAAVALALWVLSGRFFAGLLTRSPAFGLLTGALAGIVALLLWVYTAASVILFGSELAAVIAGHRPAA